MLHKIPKETPPIEVIPNDALFWWTAGDVCDECENVHDAEQSVICAASFFGLVGTYLCPCPCNNYIEDYRHIYAGSYERLCSYCMEGTCP